MPATLKPTRAPTRKPTRRPHRSAVPGILAMIVVGLAGAAGCVFVLGGSNGSAMLSCLAAGGTFVPAYNNHPSNCIQR